MLRKIIYKDTGNGDEVVMPVTPKGYGVDHGRKVTSLVMHGTGEVTLPGELALLDREIEYLLPAQAYAFVNPGANLNPFTYIERFSKWSDAGTVLRFIVSGTPVNGAVLLDPIRYEERDGTNDIYMTVPMRGYRQLEAETRQGAGNTARTMETPPAAPAQYIVAAGDTLGAIARRFYGDASLYARLAAANNIANPNLIHPGQIITLPELGKLPPAAVNVPQSVALARNTQLKAGAGGALYTMSVM